VTARDVAFRRLYEAELAYVLRTLRRLGVGVGEVPDLAHEVFIVVHRKLDDYDRCSPFRACASPERDCRCGS
jgi:RNA polymerase sigma-70 factor (ECF subfamily)